MALLTQNSRTPEVLGFFAAFVTLVFWAYVRLAYAFRIRTVQRRVIRVNPSAAVMVSYPLSAYQIVRVPRYPTLGNGWVVVSADAEGVRTWPRDRRSASELILPSDHVVSVTAEDSARGPILMIEASGDVRLALFPARYQWGEYFAARGDYLRGVTRAVGELLVSELSVGDQMAPTEDPRASN